jgi:hypothetical protein
MKRKHAYLKILDILFAVSHGENDEGAFGYRVRKGTRRRDGPW